jgi:phosphatidate cytidylyltransferase
MPSERPQQMAANSVSSGHQKRLLTSAVAIPILVLLILKGGKASFGLLVALGATVSLLEYYALVLPGGTVVEKGVGLLLGLAVIASFYIGDISATPGILALALFCSTVMCLARFKPGASIGDILSKHLLGFVYVPFLLGHLILIRDFNSGITWTFFVLSVVFAGDTAAYYVGKAIGRHRLCPSLSPGKTVEGAVGGLAANLLIGILFWQYWLPEFSWRSCTVLVVLLGLLGQIGDLAESMLKRSVGLKDSGRLLPGHGGMLDRIDGLLFAAPALYYFKIYVL